MRKFIAGLTIGLVLGTVLSVFGAQIVGHNGHLIGWTVTKDGEEICDSPFISTGSREIECD